MSSYDRSSYDRVVSQCSKTSNSEDATPFPMRGDFDVANGDVESLRSEVERLRAKHQEMMDLLNCTNPDKLVHDLRNALNEMQLLRMLTKMDA